MKKTALLVAFAAAVTQAATPFAAWTKWREISVNTSSATGGANVATAQANFPVLVRLAPGVDSVGGNILTEALANGADLRFTDSTGSAELPYEIESWSTTAGAAIWVRVPNVAGNATTKLRVYWNRSGAAAVSSNKAVFGNNGFIGVWHLGNASGSAARVNAANPGVNNAIPGGSETATMNPVPGLIGMADSMRSQSSDKEAADHMNLGQITFPQAQMTSSMWIRLPNPQAFVAWTHFFTHGNTNLEDNIWMGRENNTTNLRARSATGGAESDNPASTTITGGLANLETWIHIGVTKDSTEGRRWRVYKDGVKAIDYYGASDNHIFVPGTRAENYIARSLWADRNTHVKVDEMRTSQIARSPDWMKLEYETQKPGVTAVKLGATQTQAAPALAYVSKNVTYLVNQAITANNVVSSGTPTGFTVSPTLPAGLALGTNGTITGTPTAVSSSTQYIVSATLNAATVKDTIFIAVTAGDPPSAPLNVTGTAGLNQITVSWTAPAFPGTNPVTGYKAMAVSDTTKSCTWTTGALSCTITGLASGTSYTFRVRATSNSGASELSAPSASVSTFSAPSAPSAPGAIDNKNGSATIFWNAPANGGSTITSYKVLLVSDTSKSCTWTTGALSCTISGLTGMQAAFQVRAINAVGASPLSPASTPVGVTAIAGGFVIRMSGASKPFTFVLPQNEKADELTMNISDVWGRTVWSKTVVPAKHGRELSWNGTNSAGRRVGAGMYIVKLSVVNGDNKVELTEKAISLKP